RRSPLPRGITKTDARALLGGCDRRSALGRRDYAMLVTLLRLGLRAGEVARLRLDDIDWRAGELVVRGKGAREDRLPLPAEVGQAIASYLRRGRPASGRREVFLQARAPFGPIAPGTVSSTVRRACRRAGVAEVGALRLRRALGFKLERAGQLLPQLVAYLEAAGASTVTSDLAIAWARLPDATPNHWAQRLAVARGFARYLQTIDPAAEVPPPGVFPA